jgi:CheY-like chemotaxis protein
MDQPGILHGRRILVVEDDFLVGEVLTDLLQELGAIVVGPIGWVDEAVEFITRGEEAIDGAVLDVNLHGKKSYPIADLLIERGITFVFATGYGLDGVDDRYRGFPRCEKPLNMAALVAALTRST